MPRSCVGRGSSAEEETEGVRELCADGEECEGVGNNSRSSSLSESSSSPTAKVPSSSGTLLNAGVLTPWGVRGLSIELLREGRAGLLVCSETSARSFFLWFKRSISSWPLSSVNDRKASKRFLDLIIALMKFPLPANTRLEVSDIFYRVLLTTILMLNNSIHRLQQRLEQEVVTFVGK